MAEKIATMITSSRTVIDFGGGEGGDGCSGSAIPTNSIPIWRGRYQEPTSETSATLLPVPAMALEGLDDGHRVTAAQTEVRLKPLHDLHDLDPRLQQPPLQSE